MTGHSRGPSAPHSHGRPAWLQAGLHHVRTAVAITRRRTLVVSLAIILVPLVLLIVRWEDPSRGQLPFGWQMHTSCWGAPDDRECRS